jgi:hypothetical protein
MGASQDPFFLPVKVLSRVFRGKFVNRLKRAFRKKKLQFPPANAALEQPKLFLRFLRTLFREDWVVYAKPAFGGARKVLRYLGRYTHRVAISNHRLLAFDGERVTFRWKDYGARQQATADDAHGHRLPAALPATCSAARIRAHSTVRLPGQ